MLVNAEALSSRLVHHVVLSQGDRSHRGASDAPATGEARVWNL